MKLVTLDNLTTFLEQLNDVALGDIELHAKVQEAINEYLLDNFDYSKIAFDTGVTLTGGAASGVLGVGQLGLMVLGSS